MRLIRTVFTLIVVAVIGVLAYNYWSGHGLTLYPSGSAGVDAEAARDQAKAIVESFAPVFPLQDLKPGQQVRFNLVPAPGDTDQMEPVKVSVPVERLPPGTEITDLLESVAQGSLDYALVESNRFTLARRQLGLFLRPRTASADLPHRERRREGEHEPRCAEEHRCEERRREPVARLEHRRHRRLELGAGREGVERAGPLHLGVRRAEPRDRV